MNVEWKRHESKMLNKLEAFSSVNILGHGIYFFGGVDESMVESNQLFVYKGLSWHLFSRFTYRSIIEVSEYDCANKLSIMKISLKIISIFL